MSAFVALIYIRHGADRTMISVNAHDVIYVEDAGDYQGESTCFMRIRQTHELLRVAMSYSELQDRLRKATES